MFSPCLIHCPICCVSLDFMTGYAKFFCSKECHQEFTWREALAILGKEYHPRKTTHEESQDS